MKNISVIGSGTMGNGIAHLFAQHHFEVALVDLSPDQLQKGMATIAKNMDRQIANGTLTEADKVASLNRISPYTSLADGVKKADLVVEAATEKIEIKLDLFRQLDLLTPAKAILASNTSSISITAIANGLQHKCEFLSLIIVFFRSRNTQANIKFTLQIILANNCKLFIGNANYFLIG
jgi:3-hydroxybutyryl-CoA dehydrogenase